MLDLLRKLLDHLVRVGHHVLRHLARAVVHPVHDLDEIPLHDGDHGDGEDRDDEELGLDGVHGQGVRDDQEDAVGEAQRQVEALGRELVRVVVDPLLCGARGP